MDHEVFTREEYLQIADFLRAQTAHRPAVGLILGSLRMPALTGG